MLYRLMLCFLLSGVVTLSMAEEAPDNDKLSQTVFELERSVAMLQLSTARLEDYKTLDRRVSVLEGRVSFLSVLAFLLFVAGGISLFQLHRQHKRLFVLEKGHMAAEKSKGNDDE
ncbi:hypothetical protein [Marinomonas transparens]|uniref:Uncharacterized protein n=1 Tax=Marinomonas transparens TaxID=2795388 RepID=A0A934JT76_9GAMM|nr:hypothetical protein [Marinomonas transparens]MBJ7537887.1 hypothetical protein [Marinomonas transparens]